MNNFKINNNWGSDLDDQFQVSGEIPVSDLEPDQNQDPDQEIPGPSNYFGLVTSNKIFQERTPISSLLITFGLLLVYGIQDATYNQIIPNIPIIFCAVIFFTVYRSGWKIGLISFFVFSSYYWVHFLILKYNYFVEKETVSFVVLFMTGLVFGMLAHQRAIITTQNRIIKAHKIQAITAKVDLDTLNQNLMQLSDLGSGPGLEYEPGGPVLAAPVSIVRPFPVPVPIPVPIQVPEQGTGSSPGPGSGSGEIQIQTTTTTKTTVSTSTEYIVDLNQTNVAGPDILS